MFFYLEWNDKRPNNITLTNVQPKKLTFSSKFKIKKKNIQYVEI